MTAFDPIHRPAGHPLVSLEILEGSIALLTLCDTDRRNALRIELSLDLETAVVEAMAANVDVLVLTATPPVFCSGGDLDDLISILEPWGAAIRAGRGYPANGPHDLAEKGRKA